MTGSSFLTSRHWSTKPSWLQATLADLEQRVKAFALSIPEEEEYSDSFAVRAENYYHKRPQLLSLLHDLYNRYLTLADRYCQTLLKQHPPSQPLSLPSEADDAATDPDSDAESSLSYQLPPGLSRPKPSDSIVAELVMATVNNELLLHELKAVERQAAESGKRAELQKSLLEIMDSERLVLLSQNASLAFRASSLAGENRGLAAEAAAMKIRAAELARCVVKMRDDHRVHLLGRRIEALQAQIHVLEKRNRDCREQMARREAEKKEVVREFFFEVERLKLENASLKKAASATATATAAGSTESEKRRRRISKWWGRVRKGELIVVPCGPKQDWRCA